MTLVTTEIHLAAPDTIIVFAADRRISLKGKPHASQRKIFRVGTRQAAVGYFGLAGIPEGSSCRPMADWVESFARNTPPAETLEQAATRLADELNRAVPARLQKSEPSGFHLAGFNSATQPEFWFVRNVDDTGQPTLGRYEATEDFQGRDVGKVAAGQYLAYRNGDTRAHVAIWKAIDDGFGGLLRVQDFRALGRVADYRDWVAFKMDLIARFYKKYCTTSIIGAPIDAMAFSPSVFEGA
jgi:hypothetical protein